MSIPTLEDVIEPSITARVDKSVEGVISAQNQFICVRTPECSAYPTTLTLQFRKKGKGSDQYEAMVKASCGKCGSYIKFVKQTPEVMDRINEKLEIMSF